MKHHLVAPAALLALGLASTALGAAAVGGTAHAEEAWSMRLDPHVYQSLVADWAPADEPLCAVIRSPAEWVRILRPDPIIGPNGPFSMPAAFKKGDAVLLVARVVDLGDTSAVFRPTGLERTAQAMEVDYRFKPTPQASSTVKWYMALEVGKPLPPTVRFVENGREVCALKPDAGDWVAPASSR